MRLVTEHDDVFEAHQIAAGALQHLTLGFERVQLRPASLRQRPPGLRHLHALASTKGVVFGDDDLGSAQVG